MGKGKPLFEILQEQKLERGGQLNLSAPTRKKPEPEATPAPAPQPVVRETAEARPAKQPSNLSVNSDAAAAWLKQPVMGVPRGAIGVGLAALVAVAATGFVAGQRMGGEAPAEVEQQAYQQATNSLIEFQEDVNPELIPSVVGGVSPHNADHSLGDGQPEGEDPRIEGLNYFRLIVVPSSAGEEIYRIVDFLRENGVDAAVVPINNGRSLKVVALPGFERPRSDPRSLELREKLLRLGRKWDTEHEGSTDWRDLFAEKYVHGIN